MLFKARCCPSSAADPDPIRICTKAQSRIRIHVMRIRNTAAKAHPGTKEAHNGAMEARPGAIEYLYLKWLLKKKKS